jgi:hypothetical protein
MFIQECLIRKNTKYLRDKLKEFGYIIPPKSFFEDRKRGLLCRPNLAIGLPEDDWEYNLEKYLEENKQIIDCGTNEELFLALAALQDDTDENQWFIYPPTNYWFKCNESNIENFRNEPSIRMSCQGAWLYDSHKATVEELIDHFK